MTEPSFEEQARQRLLTALRLHDDGVALMRQNLRRRRPDASEEEIEQELRAWLATRPGAEAGVTSLEQHLRRILAELAESGVRAALVGGLAVSVRTEPRFTRDIDLAVAVADDAEAESVVARLRRRGWGVGTAARRAGVRRLDRAPDRPETEVDALTS